MVETASPLKHTDSGEKEEKLDDIDAYLKEKQDLLHECSHGYPLYKDYGHTDWFKATLSLVTSCGGLELGGCQFAEALLYFLQQNLGELGSALTEEKAPLIPSSIATNLWIDKQEIEASVGLPQVTLKRY